MSVLAGGLALGVVYALIGVAVAVVTTATRTLLLAVGPIVVAGVLVHLVLGVGVVAGLPPALAALAGLLAGAVLGALLEPLVLAPLPPGIPWLLGLAVAGVVIEAAVGRWLTVRTLRPDPLLPLGGIGPADGPVVVAVVLGLPVVVLLTWAVRSTRWGRRLRLVGGSVPAAVRSGVDPRRTRVGALAVAGAAAVGAGLLAAPVATVGVAQGAAFTVRGVAAALLLGRRDPLWALPGGLAIGLVEAGGQGLWPRAGGEVAVAALVVLLLAARGPGGDPRATVAAGGRGLSGVWRPRPSGGGR